MLPQKEKGASGPPLSASRFTDGMIILVLHPLLLFSLFTFSLIVHISILLCSPERSHVHVLLSAIKCLDFSNALCESVIVHGKMQKYLQQIK